MCGAGFEGFRPFFVAGNSTVRAFIFDIDGTLADTMPYHRAAWDAMHAELGIEVDRDAFFHRSAGLGNREIFRRPLGRELPVSELAVLSARKEMRYRDLCRPHLRALPGLLLFLQRAIDAGSRGASGSAAHVTHVIDDFADPSLQTLFA
jgi:beta-phosphoglucomutase-like phosphatase (HAD superfamily)